MASQFGTSTEERQVGDSTCDCGDHLLSIRNLNVHYGQGVEAVHAVKSLDFDIHAREAVGIVGESGSGKTTAILAAGGLMRSSSGVRVDADRLMFRNVDIMNASRRDLRDVHGRKMGFVYQHPGASLNPVMRIGDQIAEVFKAHGVAHDPTESGVRLLKSVGIPEPEIRLTQYPHELSGGMKQRVVIAMAIALNPAILIADEPTSSVDVTTQAEILNLIREINRSHDMATIIVTHDLGVVAGLCERVIVMREGEAVEAGSTEVVLHRPQAEYTQDLVGAAKATNPRQPEQTGDAAPANIEPNASYTGERVATMVEAIELVRTYKGSRSWMSRRNSVHAVNEVSFAIAQGERLGIVGESGCGKSTLARLIAGLDAPTSGHVAVHGDNATELTGSRLRKYRRRVQMIFQDPRESLTPTMTVRKLLYEAAKNGGHDPTELESVAQSLLENVHLDAKHLGRLPSQLSGGQAQRVSIARALALQPDVLVADEAVSSLDVTIKAQILELLRGLCDEYGLTLLFVSHDLAAVASLCERVCVMYLGRLVELGPTDGIYGSPHHPYTAALLRAIPPMEVGRTPQSLTLGEPPSPMHPPQGCAFHPRCPIGPSVNSERTICKDRRPQLVGDIRSNACHFHEEAADLVRTEDMTS